jgi:hypothetical protein
MAATTKLILFNAVLRELASHQLANLTTVNTRLTELNGAYDHAVEYVLGKQDWGFARRRATLTGIPDSSFPPYAYRYSRPGDYLRKCWIKVAAADDSQIDHAEAGATIYGFETTALVEYISDHADTYDPANWPPHFTKALTLYLAQLVAPKLARAGAGEVGGLGQKLEMALAEADAFEAVFLTNTQIPANRHPVFRRAIEFMGQALGGSVPLHAHTDKLRWQMNLGWSHAVKYVLEMGAWNFASKRAYLADGMSADSLVPATEGGIIEGYSLPPAVDTTPSLSVSGYTYGYPVPEDFLHKIWLKPTATSDLEARHQFIGNTLFVDQSPLLMEYVAYNDFTTDPANWSANFLEVVAAYLAFMVVPEFVVEQDGKGRGRVTATQLSEKLNALYLSKLSDAKLRDAIQQEAITLPMGRFVSARRGGSNSLSRYR